MNALRQRVPFKFLEPDERDETEILDEQEQDEVIQKLRAENDATNKQYMLVLRAVVALSSFLQLIFLLQSPKESPLLVLFPSSNPQGNLSIPLPTGFTIISLFIHLNLALLFHSDFVRIQLALTQNPRPLSYELLYALSAVAPTLSLFLQRSWQTTLWWCFTGAIVLVVQIVMDYIDKGNQNIADLETMKYTSPGA